MYFTINKNTLKVEKSFDTLRSLRLDFSDIDVSDYLDDLDTSYNDIYLISENYLSDILKKTKDESSTASLREVISLKEALDTLQETYEQTNIELQAIHSEYTKVLNKTKQDKDKISDLRKELKEQENVLHELDVEKTSLEKEVQKQIATYNDFFKKFENSSIINKKDVLEKSFTNISTSLNNIEDTVKKYKEQGGFI